MVYLFIGQDSLSKDIQLKKIKDEILPRQVEDFNMDVLHPQGLSLKKLQERFLSLPVNSSHRIVLIKDAASLKDELKEFILGYLSKPDKRLCLILDVEHQDYRDNFISTAQRFAKVLRFKEELKVDAFSLARQIQAKRSDLALKVLNHLFSEGERPERILGGLRFVFEKEGFRAQESRKKLKLLLACDYDIKTGKLKPVFALERLVVSLCSLGAANR
jgi:DNA polymerase III delta subunit